MTGWAAWRRPRRQFHRTQGVQRQIGDVDVEQPGVGLRALLHLLGQHDLDDFTRLGRCGVQLTPTLIHLRERQGRDAEQIPLHRRTHRAGIDRVVAHIGPVVDARDHQIGPIAQIARQRNVYAVRWRAVDVAKAIIAACCT